MDPAMGVLLQYGALGAIAVIALFAVRAMFGKLQATYDREKERADRLEDELRKLNEMVRTEYLRTLADATRAISDALSAVRRG